MKLEKVSRKVSPTKKKKTKSTEVKSEEPSKEKKKKKKLKVLTLTSEDFESIARRRRKFNNYDKSEDLEFAEFDTEEEDEESKVDDDEERSWIPVSDLPFKPAIDIYNLERLYEDEYCPLTLENDPSCYETRTF